MDILIDGDTGEMYFFDDAGGFNTEDIVPPDHPARKAMKVGQDIIKNHVPEGYRWSSTNSPSEPGNPHIVDVGFRPVEPPAKVGLEFLKSLERGTLFGSSDQQQGMIIKNGICWPSGIVWAWSNQILQSGYPNGHTWTGLKWVTDASKKTIKIIWHPEEQSDE